MLKEMIFLQSSSVIPAGAIGDLLNRWEEIGFFSYLLPFMLIFAMVFGILTKVKPLGDNKMVNGIIALAVALLSLQFSFVPEFFSEIFPRLGVGIAIILGILIIIGLFAPPESNMVNYAMLGVGALIIGMILIQTTGALGWQSGQWWEEHWIGVLTGAVLLVIVIAVIASQGHSRAEPGSFVGAWARDLLGGGKRKP